LTLQREQKDKKEREKVRYNLHDMLFPKGRTAKLCRLRSKDMKFINFKEILNKFELHNP